MLLRSESRAFQMRLGLNTDAKFRTFFTAVQIGGWMVENLSQFYQLSLGPNL